jgi:signal transduction histidine kinase
VTDQLLRDTLTTWPDRWLYPDLAVELIREGDRLDIGDAALLLLRGLARPHSLTHTLMALIDDGEFDSVEEVLLGLLDQDGERLGIETQPPPGVPSEQSAAAATPLTDDDWTKTAARLAQARARGAADVASRWAELEDRAAAVGLTVPDEPAVSAIVPRSLAEADKLLAWRETEIEAAERREREALESRLTDLAATAGQPDGPGLQQWQSAVTAAIAAGEFSLADAMLSAGPDDVPDAGPLTVPPPPFRWPWPDRPVNEILEWFDQPGRSPGPEFERYRPAAGDTAAAQLRQAVLRLHERADGPAVREFAVALTAVLGESAEPPVKHVEPGGFLTRLFGLHDARLPRLPILRPQGVALWIADDTEQRPPRIGGDPVIWFRPTLDVLRTVDPDVAVLDVSDLLRILAPDGRLRHGGAPARRINLLRVLLPQLDPGVVLGAAGTDLSDGASQRDSLAWLFDLIGLRPDRLALDGLLYDSGSHPVVLRCLLDAILRNRSEFREPGRVTLSDLRFAREPEVRRHARSELLTPLEADAAARMVLWLALWQFDGQDTIAPDQVIEGLGFLDPPPNVMQRFVGDIAIARTLAVLTGLGLLRRVADGRFKLPSPGLVAVLRGGLAEQELRAAAFAAMTALGDSIGRIDEATAARLGERITHLIGHRVDNDVLSIGRLLAEAEASAADTEQRAVLAMLQDKIKDLGGGQYVRLYNAALEPPKPVEVADLVRSVIGDVEWHVSKGVHLRLRGDEESWVLANPLVLREAIRNLVINSVRALEKLNRVPHSGAIAITVRQHLSPPLPEGAHVAPPCVTIEVADDGHGFTRDDLALYRYLAEEPDAPHTGRWADHPADPSKRRVGTGLLQTMAWLRDYGGHLQVLPRSEEYGGASVTAWLPMLEDRTRHETP